MATSNEPDFLLCLECESPCYTFEWKDGKLESILCMACANDDPTLFATPEEFEDPSGA